MVGYDDVWLQPYNEFKWNLILYFVFRLFIILNSTAFVENNFSSRFCWSHVIGWLVNSLWLNLSPFTFWCDSFDFLLVFNKMCVLLIQCVRTENMNQPHSSVSFENFPFLLFAHQFKQLARFHFHFFALYLSLILYVSHSLFFFSLFLEKNRSH